MDIVETTRRGRIHRTLKHVLPKEIVSTVQIRIFNRTYPMEAKFPKRGNVGRPPKPAGVRAGRRANLIRIVCVNIYASLQVLAWVGDGEREGFGPGGVLFALQTRP